MSSLSPSERAKLEHLFNMDGGYVLNFSDATFGQFMGAYDVDIHAAKYTTLGTSKAKKLRQFWTTDSDYLVGEVLDGLIEHRCSYQSKPDSTLIQECKNIVSRLKSGKVNLTPLKGTATTFNLTYMNKQIKRIEGAIDSDPDLAIGTAKELLETCCKTILTNRKVKYSEKSDDVVKLVKLTMSSLKLVPEQIDSTAWGSEILKKLSGNLSVIAQGLAELRNSFGTGHGKKGRTEGLKPRHARLAVTAASGLVHFLFETHEANPR